MQPLIALIVASTLPFAPQQQGKLGFGNNYQGDLCYIMTDIVAVSAQARDDGISLESVTEFLLSDDTRLYDRRRYVGQGSVELLFSYRDNGYAAEVSALYNEAVNLSYRNANFPPHILANEVMDACMFHSSIAYIKAQPRIR